MTERPVSRRKKLFLFWIRLICFILLTVKLVSYASYVLTPKSDYGICSMMNLYTMPDNSVDVLAVGTSLTYAGVNTNILWSDYGITAYDLCSAEQPFWISYYLIKEALKTQSPSLVLLDAKPAMYTTDYSKRGRIVLSTYGIRSLENRIGATLASVEDPMDAIDYLFGIPQVHANYKKVTTEDFIMPPDNGDRGENWMGFIEMDIVEHHSRPSIVWTDTKRNLNEREEEYFRKIVELCCSKGIELLVVGYPNPDYANDHMYYNALWAVAEEYGVESINYNDANLRFGLRYSSDFADWQHLNVKGSVTLSKRLGEDLLARYDLQDHRGDEYYMRYDMAAEEWFERLPTFESAGALIEG